MAIPPAVPYVVLGTFVTISGLLYILGCTITHNWYPLLTLIPAAIAIFCVFMFHRMTDDGSWEGGCISSDTWMFCLVAGVTSMIAMPVMFKHVGLLDSTGLWLHLAGDAATAIGYFVFVYLHKKANDTSESDKLASAVMVAITWESKILNSLE